MYLANHHLSSENANPPRESSARNILLVEDDAAFMQVFRQKLRQLGHRVFSATDVDEAEEKWAMARTTIDLVICDHVLGYDRGAELVQRFRESSPEVRIVLCSGSVPPPVVPPGITFLPKPVSTSDLHQILA